MWINDAFCHFLWVLLKVDPSGLTPWTCFARSKKDAPLWEWYMRVASSPTPILFSSSPFASLEMYLWRKLRPDSSFQITLHSSSDRPYLIRVGGSFPIQKFCGGFSRSANVHKGRGFISNPKKSYKFKAQLINPIPEKANLKLYAFVIYF